MRLFRGIAVPAAESEGTLTSISSQGLTSVRAKTYTWQRPSNPEQLLQIANLSRKDTQGPRDSAPVGICACGDEASAAMYAWERNRYRDQNTPILIEIEVDAESVAIDGNDFLYTAFQFGSWERFEAPLEALFGKRVLRYAWPAWESSDVDRRLALCDLAIHDPDVVAHHYKNKLIIGGRYHTRFRSSFLIRLPLDAGAIIRVWTPTDFIPLPPADFNVYELR
jgi:hypothetical protein